MVGPARVAESGPEKLTVPASAQMEQPGIGKDVILRVRGLSKAYPGVQALNSLEMDVRRGEIHALVGQNGAGKSTLIKMLSGVEKPDSGSMMLEGRKLDFGSPQDAQRAGIFTIFQELSLVPDLSVAENIYIGDMPQGFLGSVHWGKLKEDAAKAMDWLGFGVDVNRCVRTLTVAQKQAVELAKALHRQAKVVLLDEPSATLPLPDVERLFEVLRYLQSNGLTLVYISHRLDEVFELCRVATVLRDGRKVGTFTMADTKPSDLVRAMIGRDLKSSLVGESANEKRPRLGSGGTDEVVFSVHGLTDNGAVKDVSFELHKGEILGIAGLVGNGQAELAASIFGARKDRAGEIKINGKTVQIRSPRDAIHAGLGLLPEERKTQGLVLDMSVASNVTMASHSSFSHMMVLDRAREKQVADEMVQSLRMRVPDSGQLVKAMSGGNQQKVVLAKWLVGKCKVLIFDEPTRGVDVGAKEEIYLLIKRLVQDGGSVVMITSELPEALMCDRVLVMSRGRIVGRLSYDEIDAHGDAILELCK